MQAELAAGGEAYRAALVRFEGLAFQSKISTHAAQMILEGVPKKDQDALASSLRGQVLRAAKDPYANYLLARVIELVTPRSPVAQFIIEELMGSAYDLACHRVGCRVLQRIIEHLLSNASALELVQEAFVRMDELCHTKREGTAVEENKKYLSFVARHLLQHGLPEHSRRIVEVLRTDLAGYTKTWYNWKVGSPLIEDALKYACADDIQMLARDLLADKERLEAFAAHPSGAG
jgi:hypothetical protein